MANYKLPGAADLTGLYGDYEAANRYVVANDSWSIVATPQIEPDGTNNPDNTIYTVVHKDMVLYFRGAVGVTALGGATIVGISGVTVTDPEGITISIRFAGTAKRPITIQNCTLHGNVSVDCASLIAQDSDIGADVHVIGRNQSSQVSVAINASTVGAETKIQHPADFLGDTNMVIDNAKIGARCSVQANVGVRNEVDDDNTITEPLPDRPERTLVDDSIIRALNGL